VPRPPLTLSESAPAAAVVEGMAAVRDEQGLAAEMPAPVVAAAVAAAAGGGWRHDGRPDRTGVELVTIDPKGSRDLDQAFGAERWAGGGVRVWYAIADVAAFVTAGDPVDAEAHRRGVTFYGPDRRLPLHPAELSEGAASLLPGGERPAVLWCIDLDADGAPVATRVERAVVRSRAQLTYEEVDRTLGAGTADPALALLREVGRLRLAAEAARGGVSLPLPDQVVVVEGGRYRLAYDAPAVSEAWNAQISLLTGMEAARIMVAGGTGLLRTLPPADDRTLARLRRSAQALGVAWPADGGYPAFVRSLDPTSAAGAALLVQAAHVLRGAGYLGFHGGPPPAEHAHAAVAAPYAHVTAPLRRLCDRAATEVVVALAAGRDVPEWAAAAVATLPDVMADATRRESAYGRAALDLVEALVLAPAVGARFGAVVVDVDERRAQVQLRDPAVVAPARHRRRVAPGDEVEVVLRAADPVARRVDREVA
jgi:exoribonuclease R